MNPDRTDPFWGYSLDKSAAVDNTAAFVMDDFLLNDDALAATTFAPSGGSTLPSDAALMDAMTSCSSGTNDKKLVLEPFPETYLNPSIINQEQAAVREEKSTLENELENFNRNYDKFEFRIVESEKQRNKPYEVENNCIIAKRLEAIKIKVMGAQVGHIVKMTMRYKAETYYQQPVLACLCHKHLKLPNPDSTFYVVNKSNVHYVLEDGHHTAIISVPMLLGEAFSFSPIFRCWSSCGKNFGRNQEMILSLCDPRTGEVLHCDNFDLRVCENVGRDSRVYIKEKDLKRLKRSPAKMPKPYKQIKNEAWECEELQDEASAQLVASPSPRTRHYMVELDDELFPILDALVKVKGKKLIEIDPASLHKFLGY